MLIIAIRLSVTSYNITIVKGLANTVSNIIIIISASAISLIPLLDTGRVGFDQLNIISIPIIKPGISGDDIAAVVSLLNAEALIRIVSAKCLIPHLDTRGVSFN